MLFRELLILFLKELVLSLHFYVPINHWSSFYPKNKLNIITGGAESELYQTRTGYDLGRSTLKQEV